MKVRMWQDSDTYIWEENEHHEEIELPDAIVLEWRECRKRMEELNAYFDERVPPLVKEAEAKRPQPEGYGTITIGTCALDKAITNRRWAALMLKQYTAPTLALKKDDLGNIIIYDSLPLMDGKGLPGGDPICLADIDPFKLNKDK